jgi:threonine aldolase
MIDLGSDTVSPPTLAMRRAMADAPAGLAPSPLALERRTAERLGKKGAVYVVSDAMTTIQVREAV